MKQIPILSLLAAGTNAVPLLPLTHQIQRRDESTIPVIIIGILALLAILFIAYKIFRSLKRIAYRIAHGENMPTQDELMECWVMFGQPRMVVSPPGPSLGTVLMHENGCPMVLTPAPATQEELMRCWGVGPSGNGRVMREEARRRAEAAHLNNSRAYGLGRFN